MVRIVPYALTIIVSVGVLPMALGQDGIDNELATLDILVDDPSPYIVGSKPQSLVFRTMYDDSFVPGTRLDLEIVDAPDSAYCTCGQAVTDDVGEFELRWSLQEAGTLTLRVTAEVSGYAKTTKEFVLQAKNPAIGQSKQLRANMWIPSSMLEHEEYEGVIVTEESRTHGTRILLTSSDPSYVSVDRDTVIFPGENHAIFSISPHAPTTEPIRIFASINGPLISAESRVYSQKSVPSHLMVIFASNATMADSIMTYVFVTDDNGVPAHVNSTTSVILESDHALGAPDSVVINKGDFYTRFSTDVFGSGMLWAHANGLASGNAKIDKITRNITLQIGITPRPVGENNYAKYYVWLEIDGRPYSPPGVMVGYVHTNDTSVAGFHSSVLANSESATLYMRHGVANGTIYTRNAGAASITVSFLDMGTATSDMIVGAEIIRDGNGASAAACTKELELSKHKTNSIRAWVYPNVTSGSASFTIAQYHERPASSACLAQLGYGYECNPTTNTLQYNECGVIRYPTEADGRRVSLSLSPRGVEYDQTITLTQHLTKSFATESELDARDVGDYVLEATATNVSTTSANFSMRPQHSETYGLSITPLLVIVDGSVQDVALVSIVDSEGVIVDVGDVFGRPKKVTITGQKIEDSVVTITDTSAVFRAALDGRTTITATAPGLARGTAAILLPGTVSHVDLDIPRKVHLHEEFPFAIHEVDLAGVPIGTTQSIELVASGIDTDLESNRMKANLPGNVIMSILAEQGAKQESITVFANKIEIDVRASGATARVGVPFRIDTLASTDSIEMTVSTGIPWQRVASSTSIDVTADVPGTFPVTVTASKRGYESVSETIHVVVKDSARIGISAQGSDGASLELADVSLELSTRDSQKTTHEIALPWKREYEHLASAELAFPRLHTSDAKYVFSSVMINGREYDQNVVHFSISGDVDVIASYERSVEIGTTNSFVSGTGSYAYGDDVELVASAKNKFAFLILEVFDHWDDLPDNAHVDGHVARFVARSDHDVSAVYRDDYTGALVVLFVAMIAATGLRYYKKHNRMSLAWTADRVLRLLHVQLRACARIIPWRRTRNRSSKQGS